MRVDRRALHDALKELARLAPSRGLLPHLANVVLVGADDKLVLASTDITTRLTCELPAKGKPIETCVPARLLASLVKPAGKRAGDVDLEAAGDKVTVTIGGSAMQLPAADPQLFPAAFGTEYWTLVGTCHAGQLQEALAWVLPAASTDPTRKHLNSVFIDRDVVATDGHRLHLAPSPIALDQPLLLPSGAARVLTRVLRQDDQVVVARRKNEDQDQLCVRCGSWQLDTHLMLERFPPYTNVIPARGEQQSQVVFDTAVLCMVLAQVMKLSERGNIKVCVNGTVVLSPWGASLGKAQLAVPALENDHEGPDLELGLDGKYLLDALPRTGQVELGLGGPLDPVRVDVDERLAVIMPVRL
jgi:DNA polymerase III sliding clamp (beta) subunit (PCNA family)